MFRSTQQNLLKPGGFRYWRLARVDSPVRTPGASEMARSSPRIQRNHWEGDELRVWPVAHGQPVVRPPPKWPLMYGTATGRSQSLRCLRLGINLMGNHKPRRTQKIRPW